jgi:pyruvate/2-oxoglutarate dehydrogenase complex dihydrolipoamide acyltransferase (E2) component
LKPAGSTVPLGDIIAIIGEQGEDISALVGQAESGQTAAERTPSAGSHRRLPPKFKNARSIIWTHQ